MSHNLLHIIQVAAQRLGQPIPSHGIGNKDSGVAQMIGLLGEFCEDLLTRKWFQQNIREATLTISVSQENQGRMDVLCPFGYEGIVPKSFFNRSQMLPVEGGLSSEEWQARKAINFTGPMPAFRVRGGELLFLPKPSVGHIYTWEYYSSFFIYNPDEPVDKYRGTWEKDTDTCTVGGVLPVAFLKWKWKEAKGLDYGEDFRRYEELLSTHLQRDNNTREVRLDSCHRDARPGIVVSPGSWKL